MVRPYLPPSLLPNLPQRVETLIVEEQSSGTQGLFSVNSAASTTASGAKVQTVLFLEESAAVQTIARQLMAIHQNRQAAEAPCAQFRGSWH
jgi:hypothetical protein